MWMAWGPELTFFCNAAYRRDTLGRKYPWALGRPANEVWSEIWDDIGPRIDRVLSTEQATWDEGCYCSSNGPATPRRPTTPSPTARCVTTKAASSACCAWSARTPCRSSASGGWRRCATWARPERAADRGREPLHSPAVSWARTCATCRSRSPISSTSANGDARLAGTAAFADGTRCT